MFAMRCCSLLSRARRPALSTLTTLRGSRTVQVAAPVVCLALMAGCSASGTESQAQPTSTVSTVTSSTIASPEPIYDLVDWDEVRAPLAAGEYGEARVVEGLAVLPSGNEIHAYERGTTDPVWSAECTGATWLGPFTTEAGVLVWCGNEIVRFDASTGGERWAFPASGDTFRASSEYLAVGDGPEIVLRLLESGEVIDSLEVGFRPFTLAGDQLYIGVSGEVLHYSIPGTDTVCSGPPTSTWSTSFLLATTEGVWASHEEGTALALLDTDCVVQWVKEPPAPQFLGVGLWGISGGVLALSPTEGRVTAVGADGEERWKADWPGEQITATTSPTLVAVTRSEGGGSTVFDASTGAELLELDIPEPGLPALTTEAVVWVEGAAGGLELVWLSKPS